jgi:subfamily B ATP-binding cassette protein MsbA
MPRIRRVGTGCASSQFAGPGKRSTIISRKRKETSRKQHPKAERKAADRNPGETVPLLRRVFGEVMREHAGSYSFAVVCMTLASLTTAGTAWLMTHVVNDIFVAQQTQMILPLSATIIVLSIIKGAAAYGQATALGRIGNAVTAHFQRRISDKLLNLDLGYFSARHSSKFIARMSQNARSAEQAITLVSTSLGRDLLTVLALAAVMISQDVLMFIVALSLAPLAIFGVQRIVRQIRSLARSEFQSFAAVIAATQETVQAVRVVKAFTLEQQMRQRLNEAATGAEQRANKINRVQASASPLLETLGGISIGLVVLYAGWQTVEFGKTPGEFMAFVTAFLLAVEPMKRLARLNIGLQRNLKGVHMLYRLLDTPSGEEDAPGAIDLGDVRGHVVVKDVTFGYLQKSPVLHDVSIEAKPGEVVALVGPSGAGKSTLAGLFQRFYQPWSGSIEIDGIDVRQATIASVRRHISFVGQEGFLFSGTIYDNIAMGRPGATDLEIHAAADAALATEFIARLPKGFESDVGENGVVLSGGQRQRITIARAILRNAPILLLDEATSALDTESELQVRKAVEHLMAGRTTIVIAHRLSTIAAADRIYLMEQGCVVAEGRHAQLLATSPLYFRLFGQAASHERQETIQAV